MEWMNITTFIQIMDRHTALNVFVEYLQQHQYKWAERVRQEYRNYFTYKSMLKIMRYLIKQKNVDAIYFLNPHDFTECVFDAVKSGHSEIIELFLKDVKYVPYEIASYTYPNGETVSDRCVDKTIIDKLKQSRQEDESDMLLEKGWWYDLPDLESEEFNREKRIAVDDAKRRFGINI